MVAYIRIYVANAYRGGAKMAHDTHVYQYFIVFAFIGLFNAPIYNNETLFTCTWLVRFYFQRDYASITEYYKRIGSESIYFHDDVHGSCGVVYSFPFTTRNRRWVSLVRMDYVIGTYTVFCV